MDGSWFNKFLNKVGREYGQADKNIFGGLLPGGAATPIGAAMPRYQRGSVLPGFQDNKSPTDRIVSAIPSVLNAAANPIGTLGAFGLAKTADNVAKKIMPGYAMPPAVSSTPIFLPKGFKPTVGLDPVTLKTAELVDAGASGIASAQPFISSAINRSPEFIQQGVASGLNKLPVSANLFLRYYTGLKDKGLELPESFTNQISSNIEQSKKQIPDITRRINSNVENLSSQLNEINNALETGQSYQVKQMGPMFFGVPMGPSRPIGGSALENFRSQINNQLAEARSNQNTLNQGGIPVIPYGIEKGNPMNSISTSLGRAVFYPKAEGGYKTNETYDFAYSNADKFAGPDMMFFPGGEKQRIDLSNSQALAQSVAGALFNPKGPGSIPTMAAPTNFGRAIVSKLPELGYNYNINIPAR